MGESTLLFPLVVCLPDSLADQRCYVTDSKFSIPYMELSCMQSTRVGGRLERNKSYYQRRLRWDRLKLEADTMKPTIHLINPIRRLRNSDTQDLEIPLSKPSEDRQV